MALFRNEVSRPMRAVREACRTVLTRAVLYLTAGLAALAGLGFLLASTYGALGRAFGEPMAGLILAAGLAALAAALGLAARLVKSELRPEPPMVAKPDREAAPPRPPDLTTMAVFTAAFVLARRFPRIG